MNMIQSKMQRGYLIDHHMPSFEGVSLSSDSFNDWQLFVEQANIDHMMVYCKDHWGYSWYNTEIGTPHPLLHGFDWVANSVTELRKRNIAVTAYYCIEYDSLIVKQHPEWSTVTAKGDPLVCGMPGNTTHARWGMPCSETEYRNVVLSQLKEICERFKPDLLFLDIFGKSLCYCETCKGRFRDQYGIDLPVEPEDLIKYNREINEHLEESSYRLLLDIKKVIGSTPVTINFACHYSKPIRDELDCLYTEPWAGNRLSAVYASGIADGKPVFLGPGDISKVYNSRHANVIRLAAGEIASALGRVFMYSESMRPDGYPVMAEAVKIGIAYNDIRNMADYLIETGHCADIAVIQSDIADMDL